MRRILILYHANDAMESLAKTPIHFVESGHAHFAERSGRWSSATALSMMAEESRFASIRKAEVV
jgi:hypothetical protein